MEENRNYNFVTLLPVVIRDFFEKLFLALCTLLCLKTLFVLCYPLTAMTSMFFVISILQLAGYAVLWLSFLLIIKNLDAGRRHMVLKGLIVCFIPIILYILF